MPEHQRAQLLPGPEHFVVEEVPAYEPSGDGEHAYLWVEKRGLASDRVAAAIARRYGVKARAVGYAGRKDRHAVTRQWFSVHTREHLDPDDAVTDGHGRWQVLAATRHRNKLRTGHLRGNRFRLGIVHPDPPALRHQLADIAAQGFPNRFGPQRFGIAGANLAVARAWSAGDWERCVAWMLDPHGDWRWGDPLPEGFRHGAEGKALGALRRGADAAAAARATGRPHHQLMISAAQSAIFNAVLDARRSQAWPPALRVGDIALTAKGGPFLVEADELERAHQRQAAGEIVASGPLPGTTRLDPAPAIAAEERAAAAACGFDWSWFQSGGRLEAPGGRRPLVAHLLEAPTLVERGEHCELAVALPAGSYASELLAECGIAMPADRSGRDD